MAKLSLPSYALKKRALFVCQFSPNAVKVIKAESQGGKIVFCGLGWEALPLQEEQPVLNLFEIFGNLLKKLGYNDEPITLSLSRQNVTCRYVKIPSQKPEEIEKMAALQSSKHLPYSSEELISGYQSLSSDKEGYTYITLNIAQRDLINNFADNFGKLKIKEFAIVLSSYGICNLYNFCLPREDEPVFIIDIDLPQAEIVIARRDKLLFSRYVKVPHQQDVYQFLAEEINKTKEAYFREVSAPVPAKIYILSSPALAQKLTDGLKSRISLPVSPLLYANKIKAQNPFQEGLLASENSFASLMGFVLKEIPLSLNLLPRERKEEAKKSFLLNDRLRKAGLVCGIILVLGLGLARSMANKADYLNLLKTEVGKIEKEARPLAILEKRSQFLQKRLEKSSLLELLRELYQVLPQEIVLVNLTYEENSQLTLRGQTASMGNILALVGKLEKSPAFKGLNIKVRYATNRRTPAGEIIDFEIGCLKK